jgi:hypothetical protein
MRKIDHDICGREGGAKVIAQVCRTGDFDFLHACRTPEQRLPHAAFATVNDHACFGHGG